MNESEIIDRALAGDQNAYTQLYDQHKAKVYGNMMRMSRFDENAADEMTQEAFIQAFRKLSQFKRQSKFGTWLYRIAVNVFLMHKREEAKKDDISQSLEDVLGEELLVGDTLASRFVYPLPGLQERLTNILPDGQRKIFILKVVYGYEHEEIAQFMGCSSGNSKSQFHKAKIKIKALLGERNNGCDRIRSRRSCTSGTTATVDSTSSRQVTI